MNLAHTGGVHQSCMPGD